MSTRSTHRVGLRHQSDRPGDAGGDRPRPAVPRALRPGGQQRVPLPQILLDAAGRPRPEARILGAVLQGRDGGGPKPKTIALLAEDAEFPKNASEGRARHAKAHGVTDGLRQDLPAGDPRLLADRPRIQATNPEMVFVASYPPGSAGMLRAATESRARRPGFSAAAWSGLQFTVGEAAVRAEAQRHHRLRLVDTGADNADSREFSIS